jgi:GNAT superfamily N-acetyltransferase
MGLAPDELFRESLGIRSHGERLADYRGIFALFRDGRVSISYPRDGAAFLRACLPETLFSPERFASSFPGKVVIGPAYLGYAEVLVSASGGSACPLGASHRADAAALREACSEAEWDHGGSEVGEVVASGVFIDGKLAALAGYEVWDDSIAHISIVSHPAHRGRGHGRAAVADVARRALEAGLVPQYRTLEANEPSIRIAESLGFVRYATSVAVRLGSGA